MSLLDPDGDDPSEIILPDGSSATEVRDPDGTVVWSADSNYHLNMRDANDDVDHSTPAPTLETGQTFLAWIRYHQIGTSGNQNGPGIFAASTSGGWNDYACVGLSGGGTPVTSGDAQAYIRVESQAGQTAYCNPVTYTLGSWALWGYALNADGTINWYFNDTRPTTNYNDHSGGEAYSITYVGPGYAGATDDGYGHKDVAAYHVFDSVLADSAVADYYQSGTKPAGAVHDWTLEAGSGTTATDEAGSADGTIRNATWVEGGPA